MYAAKGGSRGSHVFFDAPCTPHWWIGSRWRATCAGALEEGEFWVAYQPIVALESHQVLGIEALLRWEHPTKGNIPPNDFISLAEETGFDRAHWRVGAARGLPAHGGVECRSASTDGLLGDGEPVGAAARVAVVVADVESALAGGVAGALSSWCLEITENALCIAPKRRWRACTNSSRWGCAWRSTISGRDTRRCRTCSSFPVDILKIDRSFTDGLMRGTHDDALARTIIALGDLLTLRTIAEGVEHARQHNRLRDLDATTARATCSAVRWRRPTWTGCCGAGCWSCRGGADRADGGGGGGEWGGGARRGRG